MRERGACRPLAIDACVLAVLTAAAAAAYVWTKAPLYNPVPSLDPWIYTSLWTNYDQIQTEYSWTYFASRLPWIVPGYLLNKFVDAPTAYFMIHTFCFLGGGLLLYLMCRPYFGRLAAACGYIGLIANQLYFNAHRWDYVDGGILFFLLASFAFAIPKRRTRGIRGVSLALSGVFSAAVVTTRIVDIVYLIGLPLVYWAVMLDDDRRFRLRRFALDLLSYGSGLVALMVGGGIFAQRHGAEFLFFMPQMRFAQQTSDGNNQIPVGEWFSTEPYFLVPIFVTILGMLVLAVGRPGSRDSRRLLIATTAWSGSTFVLIALWEFAWTGWIFEVPYYFSSLLVPSILCLTGCLAGIIGQVERPSWSTPVTLGLVTTAAIGPLLWIYSSDSPQRVAESVWRGAYLTTIITMIVTILTTLVVLTARSVAAATLAVALAFLAFNFAVDASGRTRQFARSDSRSGSTYALGQSMVTFLRGNGYRLEIPRFWYNAFDQERGELHSSLQSLYWYNFTFVGNHLPTVDADFRSRMRFFRPSKLVLLCSEPTCRGGAAALTRAGFQSREIVRRRLNSGSLHVWVVIRSIQPAQAGS